MWICMRPGPIDYCVNSMIQTAPATSRAPRHGRGGSGPRRTPASTATIAAIVACTTALRIPTYPRFSSQPNLAGLLPPIYTNNQELGWGVGSGEGLARDRTRRWVGDPRCGRARASLGRGLAGVA